MKFISKVLPLLCLTLATAACSGITTYSEGPGAYPHQHQIEARQIYMHHPLSVHPMHAGHIDAVVNFANASDKLSPEGEAQVREMAEALHNPALAGAHVVVAGYTDSTGDDAKNLQLSHHRAMHVMHILITQYHVPAAMLSAQGYGKANPIASNATAEGRAENRRVSLIVVSK